uniref:Bestrophin homolog n=1 Tax=Attheya septentrionalis TaxID=420275 RepID=A0A7S2XP54_9STRA|mmetsp:Transcript_24454/g.44232  ORF Transcript_24454/g.44232 Transcript_24454/m.44232 type:complete len:736 (+) Transcript_24454:299-2506(+)
MTHHAYQSRGFSRILCGHMNLSGVILLLLSQTCMVKAFSNHNPELSIHAGSTLRPISRTKPASGIPKRRRSDILLMPHHHAAMGSPLFRQGRRTTAASSRLFRRHPVSSTGRGGLFRSLLQRWGIRKPTTSLDMVLTTPESVFEQASTEILLDDLIDESVRTSARKPIMMQFDPSSGYIWRRWSGTVFSETWRTCLGNMLYATIIALFYKANPQFRESLTGFNILWGQLLSVTTFTLTFFLNQSYALWRKCYELSRRLQGRLNDLGMTCASHATRKTNPDNPSEPSRYTPESRQLLELIARYIRLFNLLTYASFTRSHRPILTPRGMRRLVDRGVLTPQERQVLVDAEVPATQRHNAVVLWIMRLFEEGRQAGHLQGGSGFEQQFLEKCHVIRAQYGAIGDELQGRMPLAYAHIVQVLVDVILWMYPFMAFSTGMTPFLGVLGTGLLTMFYQGLFDLAKQFLDPYDNENYGKGEDPLCVDTLIAESNAGSVRWLYSFEQQPFSSQKLRDGEMFDYLLPLRGYSVEEFNEIKEREEAEKLEEEMEGKSEDVDSEDVVDAGGEDPAWGKALEVVDSRFGDATNDTDTVSVSDGSSLPFDEDSEASGILSEEEYLKHAEILKEAIEEQWETEAILAAGPGASSLELVDDDETGEDCVGRVTSIQLDVGPIEIQEDECEMVAKEEEDSSYVNSSDLAVEDTEITSDDGPLKSESSDGSLDSEFINNATDNSKESVNGSS